MIAWILNQPQRIKKAWRRGRGGRMEFYRGCRFVLLIVIAIKIAEVL